MAGQIEETSGRRVALITGSTSGIGLEIAGLFAARGFDVSLHGLEPDGGAVASRLASLHGVRCRHDGANLLDAPAAVVTRCLADFGRVDVLVNNAGIQHVAPVEDFPPERWEQVLAVNLSAPFYLAQAAWPAMKAAGFGRIINIASVHGLRASAFKAAYVAAKHGLLGLTKVLALEGADVGITANAICPGFVRTPLVERQIDDQARHHQLPRDQVVRQVMLKKQAIKEFVAPAAVAEMAWYLASDAASTVTGAEMVLDGGWCCQ